mmetsp:Transcript_35368/g.74678  ORF Transcript_35368/g.74678 Transcript_35368/m.74678 type:complete len:144 (-) Transcript_35368:340-771(-)
MCRGLKICQFISNFKMELFKFRKSSLQLKAKLKAEAKVINISGSILWKNAPSSLSVLQTTTGLSARISVTIFRRRNGKSLPRLWGIHFEYLLSSRDRRRIQTMVEGTSRERQSRRRHLGRGEVKVHYLIDMVEYPSETVSITN